MRPGSSLSVEFTISPGLRPFSAERIQALLDYAAREEGITGEVGIWICTDDEIAELHQQFMQIAGPTDVISFPGEGVYLGDIAVSFDTAAVQAEDVGHSTERELAYLCLHGLLHLAGYDDLTPGERERMIGRQDELVAGFERETPCETD